jgi:hypothetical protein
VNSCDYKLLSGSTLPPPSLCVNKYTVYTRVGGWGGVVGGSCPREKTPDAKSLYRSMFLDDDISLPSKESYFSTLHAYRLSMDANRFFPFKPREKAQEGGAISEK